MRKWIYGFFMTWGMFLSIPCPFRRWDERARGNMMVCLPFIGAVVGGIWALTAWILERLHAPNAVAALALAALPWLTTGWIHLDGYMDVCDAVLSRRDLDTAPENSQGLSLRRLCRNFPSSSGPGPVELLSFRRPGCAAAFGADSRGDPGLRRSGCGLPAWPIETAGMHLSDRQGRAAKQAASPGLCSYCLWGFPCFGWMERAARPWRRQPGTAWQSGTASGSCKECRAISPALRSTLGELAGVAVLTLAR